MSSAKILFDLDGTLLDHEGASSAAVLDALPTWLPGIEVGHEAAVARWWELERVHMAEYLAGAIDFREQRRRRLRGFLATFGGPERCDDADADAAFAVYAASYERSWRAFDDVVPALTRLAAAGAAVAILTNGDGEQQRAKVRSLYLPLDVRVLVPADVGAAKPSPLAFVRACELLGWTPAEVLYVGDNVEVDVLGSAQAGLRACWLDRTGDGVSPGPQVPHIRLTGLWELKVPDVDPTEPARPAGIAPRVLRDAPVMLDDDLLDLHARAIEAATAVLARYWHEGTWRVDADLLAELMGIEVVLGRPEGDAAVTAVRDEHGMRVVLPDSLHPSVRSDLLLRAIGHLSRPGPPSASDGVTDEFTRSFANAIRIPKPALDAFRREPVPWPKIDDLLGVAPNASVEQSSIYMQLLMRDVQQSPRISAFPPDDWW